MNIENMRKAIAIMERAKARGSVDMWLWQTPLSDMGLAFRESQFHACGNKACFAGHIALSPEFQADGGIVCNNGSPSIGGRSADESLSIWLGLSPDTVRYLTWHHPSDQGHIVYGVSFSSVTADHVIAALDRIIDEGEEACLAEWHVMKDEARFERITP